MDKCKAASVVAGVAIGPLHFYQRPERCYDMTPCEDTELELERMEQARQESIAHQSVLYQKALAEAGQDIAAVFDVHALMLDDDEFVETVRENIVNHHMRAEYAVRCAAYTMVDRFAEVEDEYMRARIDDIMDMARGVIYLLQGSVEEAAWSEPSIVVAEEFTPSEAVQLDKQCVLGFVTRLGSTISHTSILARSMELPALVKCKELQTDWEGHLAILDGLKGRLIVDPDVDTLIKYRGIQEEIVHRKKLLRRLKGKPNETIDGHIVKVMANVNKLEDMQAAKENDAEGIGKFRTDFLFLEQTVSPDEETQFCCYKELVRQMRPQPVFLTTVDWATAKPERYLNVTREEVTELSCRGIRRSLMDTTKFRVQLRAMLRAAALGDVYIMLPMVTNVKEVQYTKDLLQECKQELERDGIPTGDMKLGVIIETPAAVWIADDLAKEVDFFAIDTNDLMQYICVIDRDCVEGVPFVDPYHPALMHAIYETIKAGHRHGIPVGICGVLGADTALTEHFLRMGVDGFSVNPTMVLPLRNTIRDLDLREPASPVPVWQDK